MRWLLGGSVAVTLQMAVACGGQTGDPPDDGTLIPDSGAPLRDASTGDAGHDALPHPPPGVDGGAVDAGRACRGSGGPPGVPLDTPKGRLCIDATEVTKSQYKVFLISTGGDTGGQTPECAWNTDYTPQYDWPPPADGSRDLHPVNNIDWCDATAFCRWAGKHLCGAFGGGPTPADASASADASAWYYACSANAAHAYPYGDTYSVNACDGCESQGICGQIVYNYTEPVGAHSTCEGGYRGLFDMSGNVEEWEDSCSPGRTGNPADDVCVTRGGGWPSPAAALRCDRATLRPRNAIQGETGFRCCTE